MLVVKTYHLDLLAISKSNMKTVVTRTHLLDRTDLLDQTDQMDQMDQMDQLPDMGQYCLVSTLGLDTYTLREPLAKASIHGTNWTDCFTLYAL
jgi:hypothetical protein